MKSQSCYQTGKLRLLNVLTSLRQLNSNLDDTLTDIIDLWKQIEVVSRAKLPDCDELIALLRLNLTARAEKFETQLFKLSSYISIIQSQLTLIHVQQKSRTLTNDLTILRNHLISVHQTYTDDLNNMSNFEFLPEKPPVFSVRNLYDENYTLTCTIRRLKADLSLY